jgi:hypothetical protein
LITLKELNKNNHPTTEEIDTNLNKLLEKLNVVRQKWGKPLIVTSGLRSQADQQRINPKAPKSAHMLGMACDFSDPDGKFDEWCSNNQDLLVELGLWQEHPDATKGWVHLDMRERPIRDRPGCLKRQFRP